MKKNFLTLFFAIFLMGFAPNFAHAIASSKLNESQFEKNITNGIHLLSKENLEKSLGKKLTLGEKLSLYFVKHKLCKQLSADNNVEKGAQRKTGKLQIVAFLLCFFLGFLGIHRFYLGYTGMGVLYILTGGLFGIGWLVDTILLIIPNGLTPKGETTY